ncbi:hypothetical protein A6R68_21643 [Neotoma lepida]|uniref:Nebulin-related-anchoring protein n=1 Tax=Neotoma lepida TaxID=56216 RepID=A0A1A6HR08_NEOLE|nr:hypothetical protein A6R68_21643 [Neotoma lepida]
MCEDEDKTVIKRRGAQGSESKRLWNRKQGSSKAETSAAEKTREEASISEQCKVYRNSWEQNRAGGYDFRLDAIPFQTAKVSRDIASDFRYKEAFLRNRGLQIGYRSINDDPRMRHFLRVGRLQSDNEYKKDFAKGCSQFHSLTDQPGFLQAKRSQQLASDVHYRQPLPQHTSDSEQLGLKHAQKAHQLQSDVKYRSDLSLTRGVGWTPPGSYKVEMARRAAELANRRGLGLRGAYVAPVEMGHADYQSRGVNPDASEILHINRKKTPLMKPLLSGAKEEGLQGSEDSTSEASLPVDGAFDPVQELGDLSVDTWLLPAFLAPAHNAIDEDSCGPWAHALSAQPVTAPTSGSQSLTMMNPTGLVQEKPEIEAHSPGAMAHSRGPSSSLGPGA